MAGRPDSGYMEVQLVAAAAAVVSEVGALDSDPAEVVDTAAAEQAQVQFDGNILLFENQG